VHGRSKCRSTSIVDLSAGGAWRAELVPFFCVENVSSCRGHEGDQGVANCLLIGPLRVNWPPAPIGHPQRSLDTQSSLVPHLPDGPQRGADGTTPLHKARVATLAGRDVYWHLRNRSVEILRMPWSA
jgi:hypothetical protein